MRLKPLSAFSDNYIWTLQGPTGKALVVDPGQAAPVLAAADRGLEPVAVLLTHHHDDHIGGARALLERWPDLAVFAPADERIAFPTITVGDGQRIEAAGIAFEVIAVPGHTRSHIAYYTADAGDGPLLFSGDTLFSLGCGRLFEGSAAQMHASLSRLAALPAATRVCCGHEYTLSNAAFARVVDPDNPALRRRLEEAQAMREADRPTLPSTLAGELAANPFLRVAASGVRAGLRQHLGRELVDDIDAFAELRRWKDGFRA